MYKAKGQNNKIYIYLYTGAFSEINSEADICESSPVTKKFINRTRIL